MLWPLAGCMHGCAVCSKVLVYTNWVPKKRSLASHGCCACRLLRHLYLAMVNVDDLGLSNTLAGLIHLQVHACVTPARFGRCS
jgi:hypothetical protein